MKKKKILVVVLVIMVIMMSGCTKYLSGEDKKRIVNDLTGQNITSNILCLPEDEDLIKIYEENEERMDVDYDSLNACKDFSPGDLKYKSLWESLFVKPLAFLIIKIGQLFNNYGLAVIILGLLIRLILLPFSKKSMLQSENMKKAQPEIMNIQKKFNNRTDQASQMQMSQEMMMIYKKYNINPAGGCIIAFIQIPILFAFLEAINRVPAIFEGYFLTLQLGTSPFVGIKNGNLLYIVLILLIVLTTYFSYKNMMNTKTGNEMQDKQMQFTMKFMVVFIAIASLSLPTALALYWIVSNAFMIFQNLILKKIMNNNEHINNNIKHNKDIRKEQVKNAKVIKSTTKKQNKKRK